MGWKSDFRQSISFIIYQQQGILVITERKSRGEVQNSYLKSADIF